MKKLRTAAVPGFFTTRGTRDVPLGFPIPLVLWLAGQGWERRWRGLHAASQRLAAICDSVESQEQQARDHEQQMQRPEQRLWRSRVGRLLEERVHLHGQAPGGSVEAVVTAARLGRRPVGYEG